MTFHDFGLAVAVVLVVPGSVSLYLYRVARPTCKNKHISNLISSVKGSLHARRFSAVTASHVTEKQR